jgi:hypothetical protein
MGPTGPQGAQGTTGQSSVTFLGSAVESITAGTMVYLPGLSANVTLTSTNAVVIETGGGLLNFNVAGGQALVDISIQDTFNGSTTMLVSRRYALLNSPSVGAFAADQGWSLTIAPSLPPGTHLISVAAAVAETLPLGNYVSVSGPSGNVNCGTLTITTVNR